MTTQEALNEMQGKTVESIQHHDIIDIIEFHFTDGSCVHVSTKPESSPMIISSKSGESL